MLLKPFHNKKYGPINTAIPSFCYLTESMYESQKANGFNTNVDDYMDLDKVRSMFSDAQLYEWAIEIAFLLGDRYHMYLPLLPDITKLIGVDDNAIKGKDLPVHNNEMVKSMLNHLKKITIRGIKEDAFSGAVIYPRKPPLPKRVVRGIFSVDAQDKIFFIHPNGWYSTFVAARSKVNTYQTRGLIALNFLNALWSQPVGEQVIQELIDMIDIRSIEGFLMQHHADLI